MGKTTRGSARRTPHKSRFEYSCLKGRGKHELKLGDSGDDVRSLQTLLAQAGYLRRSWHPGTMCNCTCDALRHYQKCYGLKDTGIADEKTLRHMQRPRCGIADIDPEVGRDTGLAPFVLRGCKYSRTNLTFAFENGSADLPGQREREIIREAFQAWAEVTPLRFTEVRPQDSPDFPIAWHRGDHGDGSSFDEGGSIQGNVLAHAYYPPPCGGPNSGAMHFDEFESWVDAATPNGIRLLNVAIHEIGHLLGLRHSNSPDAIMFAFYDDAMDSLRQDDIDGIQELYGSRPVGQVPLRGHLGGAGQNETHQIQAQSGPMTVSLIGPPGRDFDLYVRAGLPPTRRLYDARGFGATAREEIRLNIAGGTMFIMVDSWRGSGAYEVDVEFG